MKKNKIIMQGIALAMSVFVAGTAIDMSTDFSRTFAEAREQEEYSFVTDNGKKSQYIVQVDNEKAYRTLEQNSKEKEVYDQSNNIKLKSNQVMVLDVSAKEANQIKQMEGVNVLEKDHTLTADELVPVDENQVEKAINENKEMPVSQWNLEAVNAPKQENIDVTTASAVKVAVLDSGVSDLSGIDVKERVDFAHMGQKYVNENPMFDDPCGHGTGIAGVIAGKKGTGSLWGIAQDAEIYSVKVLNEKNETTVSKVVSGIYWCIDHGMDVINMSFGTQTNSEMLKKAIDDAKAAGIILVAAAGNQGDSAKKMDYPAAYDGVISVGAINGKMQICDFTSDKEKVDIYAPGEKVWTHGVLQGITPVDGTSIAAAHVTGAVALLLKKFPDKSELFMRQLLQKSSNKISDKDQNGVLNISSALEHGRDFQISKEDTIYPEGECSKEIFDTSDIVTGSWSNHDHGVTVGTVSSNFQYVIMANTASIVDTYFSSKQDYPFHGKHNYIANLHFLYKVAGSISGWKINTNDAHGLNVSDFFYREIRSHLDTISVTHTKDTWYGERDLALMRTGLCDAIAAEDDTKIFSDLLDKTGAIVPISENGQMNLSNLKWLVMGFAVHLTGDIFAHRTIVPSNTGYSDEKTASKFDINDFEKDGLAKIKKEVKAGNIEFRDIRLYTSSHKPSEYEDDTSFYPNRYNAAGNAVAKLTTGFEAGRKYSVKYILLDDVGFKMRLNNLINYTNSAGFKGEEVAAIGTKNFRVNMRTVNGTLKPYDNELDAYNYNNYSSSC